MIDVKSYSLKNNVVYDSIFLQYIGGNMDISDLLQASLDWYEKEKTQAPIKINKYKKYVEDAEKELNEAISSNASAYIIKEYQKNLLEDEHNLKSYQELTSLLRMPDADDITYRLRQRDEFPKKIASNFSHDEMLCFHGTTIFGAKNIILSNSISSGANRFGRTTSYDPPGKISATNIDTIETSVGLYMRLNDNYCYPSGCLFVITAKNKEEYANLSSGWMIDNVDFKENPERLVAIITTPENIEKVSQWAKEGGIDTSKVMDFDSFIEKHQQQKDNVQMPMVQKLINAKRQKE